MMQKQCDRINWSEKATVADNDQERDNHNTNRDYRRKSPYLEQRVRDKRIGAFSEIE